MHVNNITAKSNLHIICQYQNGICCTLNNCFVNKCEFQHLRSKITPGGGIEQLSAGEAEFIQDGGEGGGVFLGKSGAQITSIVIFFVWICLGWLLTTRPPGKSASSLRKKHGYTQGSINMFIDPWMYLRIPLTC